MRQLCSVIVAATLFNASQSLAQPIVRIGTDTASGGTVVPAGGIAGLCVPDSGHDFIELVPGTTDVWRIAGTVYGETIPGWLFTVHAPDNSGAAIKIAEIDISHQEPLNNVLRINVLGAYGNTISELGAITRRSGSNARLSIRDVFVSGQIRGYSSGFSSSLRAPITANFITKLHASSSIRIDARLDLADDDGVIGSGEFIKSDSGSITGYIGGPSGASGGSRPTGVLIPLIALNGCVAPTGGSPSVGVS